MKTPKILAEEEFKERLQRIEERLDNCGYEDQRAKMCYLIGAVGATEEIAYTGAQLKQIFDLAFHERG